MSSADTRQFSDSSQRRNGFRRLPRVRRQPWFLRGCSSARLTLVAALLILLILTIALPAWVLSAASRAERDADMPGPSTAPGMLAAHCGLAGLDFYLPHADLTRLATRASGTPPAPPDGARELRMAVRAGKLACPPPAAI